MKKEFKNFKELKKEVDKEIAMVKKLALFLRKLPHNLGAKEKK